MFQAQYVVEDRLNDITMYALKMESIHADLDLSYVAQIANVAHKDNIIAICDDKNYIHRICKIFRKILKYKKLSKNKLEHLKTELIWWKNILVENMGILFDTDMLSEKQYLELMNQTRDYEKEASQYIQDLGNYVKFLENKPPKMKRK